MPDESLNRQLVRKSRETTKILDDPNLSDSQKVRKIKTLWPLSTIRQIEALVERAEVEEE